METRIASGSGTDPSVENGLSDELNPFDVTNCFKLFEYGSNQFLVTLFVRS